MSDAIALPRRRARGRFRKVLPAYLLIAPAIASSIVFLYIPIFFSGYWSFTKYNGLARPEWVGLQNYTDLLSDPRFQKALLNTVIFVIIGMGIGPILGLMSALLLNQAVRGRGFFRTAYFLPVMTSLVVVATIWKVLLNQHGIVNQLLGFFSVPAHNWLGDPSTALVSVAITSIWQGFGFETVVFLAALQSVPRDLYDAALVDGADAWQRFRYVTLPALRPTIAFVYIIGIIGSFQVYDQIFVMTSGGPINSTRTIVFDLVDRFDSLKYGEASAVAYVLLVILATLSYVQMRVFEEREMTARAVSIAKGRQTGRRLRPGVRVAIYVSLIVTSIVMIGPFYWTFATSFKPAGDVFASPPKLIPNPWTMQNYRDVFTLLPFQRYFINSVIVTTAIVGLNVVFDTAAAYAFAKLRFPGRNVLFFLLLLTLMVPFQVNLIPLYRIMVLLHQVSPALGVDTYSGIVLPGMIQVFGIFLMRQFLASIPDEVLESARVDGASEFRILRSVIFPIAKPGMATLAIFTFLGAWNDFLWPNIVINSDSMRTMPVGLALLAFRNTISVGPTMAGTVLVAAPMIVIFLLMQRRFIEGLTAGSVKG